MAPRRCLTVVALLAVFATGHASPASAQGVALQDVLEVVRDEPELARQIDVELRRQDLKVAGIACLATRHGSEWQLLNEAGAAPYTCRIGSSLLRIEAQRTYFDGSGRRLGQVGKAPEQLLFNRARYFREGNFRWSWSN